MIITTIYIVQYFSGFVLNFNMCSLGKKLTYNITKAKRKISIFSLFSLMPQPKNNLHLLADPLLPIIYSRGGSLLWLYVTTAWDAFKKHTDSWAPAQALNKNLGAGGRGGDGGHASLFLKTSQVIKM